MTNFPLATVYLESVDSTNNYLKRLIKENTLENGLAVMAKSQSSGRGRLGRTWLSGEGTLCMSIAIKNKYSEGFTLLAALAVYEGLKVFLDLPLEIKWPNDIISVNKKLAGILCERVNEYTVIGVGININDKSFDDEISHKATSMYLLSGKEYEVKEVFKALVKAFENTFEKYDYGFTKEALAKYKGLCANIGKNVRAKDFSGVAVDVLENGSLTIEAEGVLRQVSSGEVVVHDIY